MASGKEPRLVVRVDRPTDPAELAKMIGMSGREMSARLGTFRMREGASLHVDVGGRKGGLDENIWFEMDGRGQWHGVRENSRDTGVEAWWSGGALAVRMRFSKPVRHRPEGSDVDRMREDLVGDPGAYWALVARFAQLSDGGMTQAAGRSARLVRLSLRSSPKGGATAVEPERKWRNDVVVRALAGSAALDAQTGAPLALEWQARYTYPKDGLMAQADMQIRREVIDVGQRFEVALPPDVSPTPVRPRWEMERRELLDGLVQERTSGGR